MGFRPLEPGPRIRVNYGRGRKVNPYVTQPALLLEADEGNGYLLLEDGGKLLLE